MIEKSGFIVNPPFQQWRRLRRWGVASLALIMIQLSLSSLWLWRRWDDLDKLIVQKNAIQQGVINFDEIVRKKNKLLAQDEELVTATGEVAYVEQIGGYLGRIEAEIPSSVRLISLNFKKQKIELVGISRSLASLSRVVLNLQKLEFVEQLSLEQVTAQNVAVSDQYQFAINLSLRS